MINIPKEITPFTTNQQKGEYAQKQKEMAPRESFDQSKNPDQRAKFDPNAPQPMVNLQVYQPPKPPVKDFTRKDLPQIDASWFIPTYTSNPYFPQQYGTGYDNSMIRPMLDSMINPHAPMIPTIVKNFNISQPRPTEIHEKVSYIYEDLLPTVNVNGTITTLSERNTLRQYLRSILFAKGDGEDVSLDETGNSLLTQIKYLGLNPYDNHNPEHNPTKSLPKDFVLYRTCYPIRKDTMTNTTKCARNAIGVNLRVHRLIDGAQKIINKSIVKLPPQFREETAEQFQIRQTAYNTMRKELDKLEFKDFDLWREVLYYHFITSRILSKKICPNLVGSYGYYTSIDSGIDFDKIYNDIQGKGKPKPTAIRPDIKSVQDLMRIVMGPAYIPNKKTLNSAMILLTEAPTHTLMGFSSSMYERDRNVKRMVSTGFHSASVWKSVIFQILSAFYVLEKNGIAYTNFHINHNVFIKDISLSSQTSYWKYIIDGIEYNIPNNGYVAQLDTGFLDFEINDVNVRPDGKPKYHKIISTFFNDKMADSDIRSGDTVVGVVSGDSGSVVGTVGTVGNVGTVDNDDRNIEKIIHDMTIKNIKNTFDRTIFSNRQFTTNGGITPVNEILDLFDKISRMCDDTNITVKDIIEDTMMEFVNNRVGTFLKDVEASNVNKSVTINSEGLKKGTIYVNVPSDNPGTYMFIMCIDPIKSEFLTRSKTNGPIVRKSMPNIAVNAYSQYEKIEQNFKPNELGINENELLETYNLE